VLKALVIVPNSQTTEFGSLLAVARAEARKREQTDRESNAALSPDQRHPLFMRFLGHRNIKNTLLYFQLVEVLFKETSEQYTVRAASNIKEPAT